jgi:spore maturation protein CgeB
MRAVLFCHSIRSDWNHGNAHFLRGVATELIARGNAVSIYEPEDGWSASNLASEYGPEALEGWRAAYPLIQGIPYRESDLDLDSVLSGADLVLVHEWNSHSLVARIGRHRAAGGQYILLFHDTHHRAVTDRAAMAEYRLENYDGVLAFGRILRDLYLEQGWAKRAWVWHEAADTRVFNPVGGEAREGDVVWIGNWGDDERARELKEFLFDPVRELGLRARVYGVRYPEAAQRMLRSCGIEYAGWLPNYEVPKTFGRYLITVHIPRGPYVEALPGIPTIRMFEALACGIPLISAPWNDIDNLFSAGCEYLVAHNGSEMKRHMKMLLENPEMRARFGGAGIDAIATRHSCAHRVDELMSICQELRSAHRETVVSTGIQTG